MKFDMYIKNKFCLINQEVDKKLYIVFLWFLGKVCVMEIFKFECF